MAGTRMVLGNTRMEEEDGILNVKWSLVVRVWGSDTRSIRVWNWALRVWILVRRGQYAYGHRQYAYGQNCEFSVLLLCSFWLFRLSVAIQLMYYILGIISRGFE